MLVGEAAVIGRVPVLRCHNKTEPLHESIGHGYDGVPVRNGEGSARHEVILKINDDECSNKMFSRSFGGVLHDGHGSVGALANAGGHGGPPLQGFARRFVPR